MRHLVGYFEDDGVRCWMTVDVEVRPALTDGFLTVEHEPCPAGSVRFSVSGLLAARGRTEAAGQIVDDLARVTEFADGWDATRRDELLALWGRWHLNDLRAGCAHQEVVYERDRYGRRVPSLEQTRPCTFSGYRYGSAWLYEPIPADVLARMLTFAEPS